MASDTPAPLTAAEIAALREIEQRATPGPWIHGDRFDGPDGDTGGGYANDAVLAMPDLRAVLGPSCRSGADARLIAAIRNAAPALLAAAEDAARLREEVAYLSMGKDTALAMEHEAVVEAARLREEANALWLDRERVQAIANDAQAHADAFAVEAKALRAEVARLEAACVRKDGIIAIAAQNEKARRFPETYLLYKKEVGTR